MSMTLTKIITLTTITCGGCGIEYAVPEDWRMNRQKTGDGFFCPNGCRRCYRESDIDVLQRKNKELAQKLERSESHLYTANVELAAKNAAYNKMKARIKKGVCPCCNRTFQNLMRHMEKKHPKEFSK